MIGRIGNYFNQELYGLPTTLPWKIFINPEHRLKGYEQIEFYHPLFAYEIILNLAYFFLLFWISRRFSERLRIGDLFLIYLINYSVIRFGLEFMRLDVARIHGININQAFMAVIVLVFGGVLYLRSRLTQKL